MPTVDLRVDGGVVAQLDYDIILSEKLVYINELAVYGNFQRRGYGTIIVNNHIPPGFKAIGISTSNALGFWSKMGAVFSEVKDNGDVLFVISK